MTDAELTLDALERMGGKPVTFYVGIGGDDGNWGRSAEEPMKSWRGAYKLCLPGDRIAVAVDVGKYIVSYPTECAEWLNFV